MSAKHTKITSPDAEMDWAAFDAQTDDEIEAAVAKDPNAPPILGPEWFAQAEVVLPGRKRPISIRLDEEVLHYFQAGGEGYQSRINAVLKHYVRAKRRMEAMRGLVSKQRPPRRRATRKAKT